MAKISPFQALRPKQELAAKVATLPYDVVSEAEARAFRNRPYNFYHVTRSEIDLAEGTDPYSPLVYEKAKENLDHMIAEGILVRDKEPCYYIYELEMDGHVQTGLVCASSVDDYEAGIIKKHEFTRPVKEQDRINHIVATRAQTGVVFLAYRDHDEIQEIIEDWKKEHVPVNNFVAEDGVRHTLWVIDDYSQCGALSMLFNTEVPATYIADGHHRAASAAKVCAEMRQLGYSLKGEENFNYFLTCIFPASQLRIMDYNRVATDLHGMSPAEFLRELSDKFEVEKLGGTAYKPKKTQEFGMYLDGVWYKLNARPGSFAADDPKASLDVSILQDNVLGPLLGIRDPRTDKRVDFVGGIRGLGELQRRVDSGDFAVAFACYPVSIEQLFAISDAGEVMPPKSTWFEPKLRDGLVVYRI